MKKHSKKKGFTLVELLVVIAILAILASVSVVGYLGFTEKAKQSVDEQLCTQYNTLIQAQSVIDDDITLSELIVLIESNGIRSNHFKTTSKGYTFAYHKDGPVQEVVLLDKSGKVAFPKNLSVDASKLWGSYDGKGDLNSSIGNYTLFRSAKYVPGMEGFNYDLNHNAMTFATGISLPSKLSVDNGVVINHNSGNLSNLETGSKTKVFNKDQTENVILTDEYGTSNENNTKAGVGKFLSEKIANTTIINETKTIKGLFASFDPTIFASANPKSNMRWNFIVPDDVNYVFEDCIFDNVRLDFTGEFNHNIEIRNCSFFNSDSYAINISSPKQNIYIHDNVISSSLRGIAIGIPKNTEIRTVRIENNEFNLNPYLTTEKEERKDNALQVYYNWEGGVLTSDKSALKPEFANFKFIMKNNKINQAAGVTTLHENWYAKTDKSDTYINALIEKVLTSEHFDISNNEISGKIEKCFPDYYKSISPFDDKGMEDPDYAKYMKLIDKFASLVS